MPSFQGQLNEDQLLGLIAYIKSIGVGAARGIDGREMDPGVKMQEFNPPPADYSSTNSDPRKR